VVVRCVAERFRHAWWRRRRQACATGEHIKDATISVRKAGKGQQEFLIIKMSDVVITGVAPGGGSEAAGFAESVALQFAKVHLEYRPQKADAEEPGNPIALPWMPDAAPACADR
jgi:type VI protein secretion system component Hcp